MTRTGEAKVASCTAYWLCCEHALSFRAQPRVLSCACSMSGSWPGQVVEPPREPSKMGSKATASGLNDPAKVAAAVTGLPIMWLRRFATSWDVFFNRPGRMSWLTLCHYACGCMPRPSTSGRRWRHVTAAGLRVASSHSEHTRCLDARSCDACSAATRCTPVCGLPPNWFAP